MTARSLNRESLTCQDLEGTLHCYVDGELESHDRAEVEEHLAACPACQSRAQEQRAYKRQLLEAARNASAPAPENVRARIAAALEREALAQRRRRWRPLILWPAAAAAAAASVAVFIHIDQGRARTAAYVAAAVANHQRQLPMEVQDSQLPQIRSWFQGKVAFAPARIPQLNRANLLGARLSHLKDREAAYVAWDAPGRRRVSLFVFDAADLTLSGARTVEQREIILANQHGYNVAIWKDNEIAYSLVSDLDEKDILELVSASQR